MQCYGKKYNKIPECKSCKYASYCRDASYKSSNHVDATKIDNYIDYSTSSVSVDDLGTTSKVATIMSEALRILQESYYKDLKINILYIFAGLAEIYRYNPKTYEIVLLKLIEPYLSYQQIADKIGMSKQLVQYHLVNAKRRFPELDEAILVDQRRMPKTPRVKKQKIYTDPKTREIYIQLTLSFDDI